MLLLQLRISLPLPVSIVTKPADIPDEHYLKVTKKKPVKVRPLLGWYFDFSRVEQYESLLLPSYHLYTPCPIDT